MATSAGVLSSPGLPLGLRQLLRHAQEVPDGAAHADDRDVFVLQLEGEKDWRIYSAPVYLPYPDEQVGKNGLKVPAKALQTMTLSQTLREGDVLYIPRGFVHEASTENHASLHVTLAIPTFDWSVSRVLTEALQHQMDGLAEEKQNPWRCSVPFFRAWEEEQDLKAALNEAAKLLDLRKAKKIFAAKNAMHNEQQGAALRRAESLTLPRKALQGSSRVFWCKSHTYTSDLHFAPWAQQLQRLQGLGRPIKVADLPEAEAEVVRKRKMEETTPPPGTVSSWCFFSRICFAAVGLENGWAQLVE